MNKDQSMLSIKNYLKYPRDFETIFRSIVRKLRLSGIYPSYGLLSGQNFKALIQHHMTLNFEDLKEWNLQSPNEFVFVEALPTSNTLIELSNWLNANHECQFRNLNLVVHNGDQVLSKKDMDKVASHFKSVFSVNTLESDGSIFPIPLGLENQSKLRNGVQRDFAKFNFGKDRDIDLLIAFSISTNPEQRTKAQAYGRQVPNHHWVTSPLTPRKFRKLLARSKYVLSPPGNGMDCHRTWEALYFGAIPILLDASWPFGKFELPVLTVKSWEELTLLDLTKQTQLPRSDIWRLYDVGSWLKR